MEKTVELLKAIADETRFKIILLLSKQEMAVCEFMSALNLSQPAVSHHLKILKQARLIKDHRKGRWSFYTIDHHKFKDLESDLDNNLFLPIQEYYKKGVLPSRIRLDPCLCEKLKQETVKEKAI